MWIKMDISRTFLSHHLESCKFSVRFSISLSMPMPYCLLVTNQFSLFYKKEFFDKSYSNLLVPGPTYIRYRPRWSFPSFSVKYIIWYWWDIKFLFRIGVFYELFFNFFDNEKGYINHGFQNSELILIRKYA